MSSSMERSAVVRPSRVLLSLLVTIGACIGFFPLVLFIERFWLLAPYALAAAIVAYLTIRRFDSLATVRPTIGEYFLGTWNGVAFGAFAAATGLILAGALWLVWTAAWKIGDLLGWWSIPEEPNFAVYWIGVVVGAAIGLVAAHVAAENLTEKLFPKAAGTRSVYYGLLVARGRLVLLSVLAAVILTVVLLVFPPFSWLCATLLTLVLLVFSSPLEALGEERVASRSERSAESAVAAILRAAGFEVVIEPRTGVSDIDPLLLAIDLLASRGDRVLAVEVKVGDGEREIDWYEASKVQTGAAALRDYFADQGQPSEVVPVLLLVGCKKSSGLRQYLESSSAGGDSASRVQPVVVIEQPKDLTKRVGKDDPEGNRAIAREVFGALVALPDTGPVDLVQGERL